MKKIAVLAIALGFTCVPSFAQYDDEDYGETPAATEDNSYSTEESTQAEPAEEAESAAPAAEKSSDDTDYQKIRLGGHIGVGVGGLGLFYRFDTDRYNLKVQITKQCNRVFQECAIRFVTH